MSAPTSITTPGRLEDFQRAVRQLSRPHLLATADLELRRLDQAILAADRPAMAAARWRLCCAWNELDRRDGTLVEVAS
jgi:hypothetical protein